MHPRGSGPAHNFGRTVEFFLQEVNFSSLCFLYLDLPEGVVLSCQRTGWRTVECDILSISVSSEQHEARGNKIERFDGGASKGSKFKSGS